MPPMLIMVIQMSTTQNMTNKVEPTSSIPPVVTVAALVVVVVVVAVAAFIMFGPKPEPHARYNTAELMLKAQKNINSLTPDERSVYDHITHADRPGPQFQPPPAAKTQ